MFRPLLHNGHWLNRYNYEIYDLHKEMEVTRISAGENFSVGGSCDEDEGRNGTEQAFQGYIEGRRPVRRLRRRWIDAIDSC
jgi:hypothetical protein